MRSDVPLCSWNSPALLAGNTGLNLSRSMSAKQSGWIKICGLVQERVYTLYKHMYAIPAAVTSDLKQRFTDIWTSISQNVIDKTVGHGESGYVRAWRRNDNTLNIC